MKTAREQFCTIANRACDGDKEALAQLKEAGERFIEEAGRFAASPAQDAAIREVSDALARILGRIDVARRQTEYCIATEISKTNKTIVDILKGIKSEVCSLVNEVKRLR